MASEWEYLCEDTGDLKNAPQVITQGMNQRGAQGWELVSAQYAQITPYYAKAILFWKRPATK
jgi:hypothetical protein